MSWWVGKSREEFIAAAPAEQHRMAYAGKTIPIHGDEVSWEHSIFARPKRVQPCFQQNVIWSHTWQQFVPFIEEGE